MRNTYIVLVGKLAWKMGGLGVDGMIILKLILHKQGVKMQTGFK
jgi:hypothetical protein